MKKTPHFPIRLFRWVAGKQIFASSLLFLLIFVSAFIGLGRFEDLSEGSLEMGRWLLSVVLIVTFVLTSLLSLFMTHRLVIPLGRLIEKTRRLREFPFADEDLSESELAYDEPGEWYELERALNKLGRDLRQKTIQLSREKTELRAIMSAVSEAILAIDLDRRPLFFNSQLSLLFDLQAREGASLSIQDIIRAPGVLEAYERSLKTGEANRVEVDLNLPEHLAAHTFQVSVAPLKKKHNQEIYGAVGIFHDITDLKKAERIRIDFVGNVSHELRTPMTSLKGYAEALKDDYEAGKMDQAGEFIEIIHRSAGRLTELVEDLLDLSSLESGTELNWEEVNTREVTEDVISQIKGHSHEIHIHYQVQSFWADSGRVGQVLRNLLHDAIRYVPQGGRIDVLWEKGPGEEVLLKVKDDGPGIAYEHQERLFERFYRIDEARSRTLGGTGIGLSIVKHIMQRHGGSVEVKSEPGHGAEFLCTFKVD